MYLENLVFDAVDPGRLGRFWEAALGTQQLTDEPDGYETRLAIEGGPELDLCFQRVPEPPAEPLRLHLDLYGDAAPRRRGRAAARARRRPRRHRAGRRAVGGAADPEGNPFCVMEHRPSYADTGPIAALPLDSADPDRDADVLGVADRLGRRRRGRAAAPCATPR